MSRSRGRWNTPARWPGWRRSFVSPARPAQGIGQRLLTEVCRRAEARGCVSVDLEVQSDHRRALHLYLREGFQDMERAHFTRPLKNWDW